MMDGTRIQLQKSWVLGELIAAGGFGRVYLAEADTTKGVLKFVPKAPGAERELLFEELSGVRNIVPIVDSGQHGDYWILAMPLAERSLRDELDCQGGRLPLSKAVEVLKDVADALVDLDSKVVHRDLKPENVLYLDGHWCLADFGIARYAEATTDADTRKFALSPPYAAPERWRGERATGAADVYALGVVAFEMLAGRLPFTPSTGDDWRDQHLHIIPPSLPDIPVGLRSLVDECLFKTPAARPTPANVRERLERSAQPAASPGLSELREAHEQEVRRQADSARSLSEAQTEEEQRRALLLDALRSFELISETVRQTIQDEAPSATDEPDGNWTLKLGDAVLRMTLPVLVRPGWGTPASSPFDVVAAAQVRLDVPQDRSGYAGRRHSLWYSDAQSPSHYRWYETAFMFLPLGAESSVHVPFALDPGPEAAGALGRGIAEYQVAWKFTPLSPGDLDDFLDRWAGWFAAGAQGKLRRPLQVPEHPPAGSWRN